MYIEGHDLLRIQYAGRWACAKTLSAYVQEAMTALIWSHIGDASTVQSVLLTLPSVLSVPVSSWKAFFSRAAQSRVQGGAVFKAKL